MNGAKERLWPAALVVLLLATTARAQTNPGAGVKTDSGGMVLDRVVAVVNEEALTLSEIQEEGQPVVRKVFQDFVGSERDRQLEQAEKKLMDDLIDRRLMYQVAKKEGTLPSDVEINGAIDDLKKNNKVTDDAQFRAMLKAEGLTLEQIRRSIGERMAIGRLLARQIRASIIIDEEELKKFYQSNEEKFRRIPQAEIRHIFFGFSAATNEEAVRVRAEEALAKIQAGADFVEIARAYAETSGDQKTGELLTVHRGDLAPEIEAAAFGLKAGAVSPLIRTDSGYHLIKVESVQAESVAPYSAVRESIRDQLFQEKFEAKRKDWLTDLRSKAFIQVMIKPGDLQAQSIRP
ncbi:MAG TPA: peptidyl-prolyl cis-trans isomerase [Candidatus Acidoferrum sp.]|nr:peptidyl-prolyl cis-trans isomerase [Candidatus Acidoferrum sp.]